MREILFRGIKDDVSNMKWLESSLIRLLVSGAVFIIAANGLAVGAVRIINDKTKLK